MGEKVYDENQLKAIRANGAHFLVLAPPGCGKTDILAERIMHAHRSGVPFSDMLCLTFTNRASRGMRDRIREKIGESAEEIFVGNIHRYCSKYLFANAVVPENTSIMDEEDQTDLFLTYDFEMFTSGNKKRVKKDAVRYVADLSSYIRQSRLEQPENVKFTMENFQKLYSLALKCNFDETAVPPEHRSLRYALRYLKYKEERNLIDFADILILAYQHMAHTPHQRYGWIQVDEVQDLNFLQLAIVDQLTGETPTVMYLGDEQQAIFSFMGAKLSLLTVLKDRCGGNVLTLDNNYRAPQYLLDICNDYAENELDVDPALLPTSVKDDKKGEYDVVLAESANIEAEHRRVLSMVKYYLSLDDEERLAILVTRNDDADEISKTLSDANISNFKISGIDMFKTKSYKTLSSFYCVLANDFNFLAWSRLLYGIGAIRTLVNARTFMSELQVLMMTPNDLLTDRTYLHRFCDLYENEEIVIFDTETTGLNVMEDDIVQIAAFKVSGGRKVPGSDFNILLHTDREIPAKLGELENPLVAEYASWPHLGRAEGLQKFLDYAGDCPLFGHNVNYDYLMLKFNAERELGEAVEFEIVDSLHIIKCVEPSLRSYKLEFLVDELKLSGKNSHLANEDIEATKSLLDYCLRRAKASLCLQDIFLLKAKTRNIASRMQILSPLFDNVRSYLYLPVSVTQRTIADELSSMYQLMLSQNIIDDLNPKYTVFLKYVQNEWVDPSRMESLFDQICTHIYDITSSINEGDLVNSEELMQDRVFIMTVYKGKGLEFENVVVLGAVDGTYPYYLVNQVLNNPRSGRKEREQAQIDRREDARKFYVAISRAKKRLCVSYTRTGIFGYRSELTPFMNSIIHHFRKGRGQ